MAKAAVGFKQLLAMRDLRRRSRRMRRVSRRTMNASALGRHRRFRRSLGGRLLAECDRSYCKYEGKKSNIRDMSAQINCPPRNLIGTSDVRRAYYQI